jgi:hypothetical protein
MTPGISAIIAILWLTTLKTFVIAVPLSRGLDSLAETGLYKTIIVFK